MRHWYLLIVLAFIAFVIVGKPSTATVSSQPLITRAATEVDQPRESQASTMPEPPHESAIFDFFNTHPEPGVRDDLHRLLRNEQVRVSWNVVGAAVAAFGVTPDERGELVPVLVMDPELFQACNRSLAQITVYHEYQHYLQWRDGTISKETFLIRDSLPRDEIHDWCKEKWHAEELAYHEACAFGRTNGLVQDLRPGGPLAIVCTAEGSRFDPTLKSVLTRADPSGPTCSKTWDSI